MSGQTSTILLPLHDDCEAQSPLQKVIVDSKISIGSSALDGSEECGASEAQNVRQPNKFFGDSGSTKAPWITAWIRFGPLTGLLGLSVAFVCIFASLAVLIASDNAPTADWTVQPSVYLGVIVAIGNQATRYAALQGATISWWVSAMQKKSTLRRLHRQWESSSSPLRAVSQWHRISLLGIACILSTVIAIDGPLLQRASKVVTAPIVGQYVNITTQIAPEVPTGFTGEWSWVSLKLTAQMGEALNIPASNGSTPNNVQPGTTDIFAHVQSEYVAGAPLSGFIEGCEGNCQAKVRAPALSLESCRSWNITVDFKKPANATPVPSDGPPAGAPGNLPNRWAFVTEVGLILNGTETLSLTTAYSTTHDCAGVTHLTSCSLVSAIGEYDVTISNNIATLVTPVTPTIIARANNSNVVNDPMSDTSPWHLSTLGGMAMLFENLYSSEYYCSDWHGDEAICDASGPIGQWMIPSSNEMCLSFRDPQEDILSNLQTAMFRVGVFAAQNYTTAELESSMDPGLSANSTVIGTLFGTQSVFNSTYAYFFGSMAVDVVCLIFILCTYWGWWRLGREVSMSPLETAKAFDAPLLRDCNSNSSGSQVVRALGDQRVRYGVTSTADESGGRREKFVFADSSHISSPKPEVEAGN